jgi:calcineurin-like phosphoesterase family protein
MKFTSDAHFGHTNVIRYNNRPYKSANEMDADLIDRWNSVVQPKEVIYHVGDFTLEGWQYAASVLAKLNGEIHLIRGSHDDRWIKNFQPMKSATGDRVILEPSMVVEVSNIWKADGHDLPLVLCHYAMTVWPRSHYGALHMFGHSHGRLLESLRSPRSLDIGVDCWNYTPISFEQFVEALKSKGEL